MEHTCTPEGSVPGSEPPLCIASPHGQPFPPPWLAARCCPGWLWDSLEGGFLYLSDTSELLWKKESRNWYNFAEHRHSMLHDGPSMAQPQIRYWSDFIIYFWTTTLTGSLMKHTTLWKGKQYKQIHFLFREWRRTQTCAPSGGCRRWWRGCVCTRRSHSWKT